jgi:MoaA/NifB/PqqE/SkfB family radical SAM enzyme
MRDYKNKGKWNDIQVHLTNDCTFKCIHCYTNSNNNNSEWLPISIIKKLIPFIKENNKRIIRLLGGEIIIPQKKINKYLDLLNTNRIRPIICTNGYFYEELVNICSQYFFDEIIISLYGFKQPHEYITQQRKSFENAIKSLKFLAQNKYCTKTLTVNTSITKYNYQEFVKFILFLKSLKIDEIKILSISPLGRCEADTYNKIAIDTEEFSRIISSIQEMSNDIYPMRVVYEPMTQINNCRIYEQTMISIDYQGNVYPCHLLVGMVKNSIGNINDRSLIDILENYTSPKSNYNLKKNNVCIAYSKYTNLPKEIKSYKTCPLFLELIEK